ncbi:MAG: MBL fold metallo-hydrolase [Deltaproteobacteria bacterium]|nr:MBL fold metallo-hydrolase [Deltaproteobacteria bacterium]
MPIPNGLVTAIARSARGVARDLGPGLVQLRLSTAITRRAGFDCTPFLVDELLVDTGYSLARGALLRLLEGRPIRGVALTHHHEDHSGNAGEVQRRRACPVWLQRPEDRHTEGVDLLLPYRQLYWGVPDLGELTPMPTEVHTGARTLLVVPTPGHSRTHAVLFDPEQRAVLSGDLFISSGASAVLAEEDPAAHARSLRQLAALEPLRLLTGHGADLPDATARLLRKADRIEEAIGRVLRGAAAGEPPKVIAREAFQGGWARERWTSWMTQGDFSRQNFVRRVIALSATVP